MSRTLTAAQIVGQGDYLNSDFDPSSLTISQLLGVLGYHGVQYPTPYTKPKLVQCFNTEIAAKATKLKRERHKHESSIASEEGITDGHTGKPLGGDKPVVTRRTSRRLSRAPSEDQDTAPARPDPPKRRRSSAQPSLGGPSRKSAAVQQPIVIEESEPEEEEEIRVRKVSRSKKSSQAAGSQARRASNAAAEDSGWEDNNIFQSGAESSSPVRPPPVKKTPLRTSIVPRRSRKSASAPPQLTPTLSPVRPTIFERSPHSPPESKFEPSLPPSVSREPRTPQPNVRRTIFVPVEHSRPEDVKDEVEDDELNLVDGYNGVDDISTPVKEVGDISTTTNDVLDEVEVEVEADGDEQLKEQDEEDQSVAISRRIAQGGQIVKHRPAKLPQTASTPLFLRLLFYLVALAGSAAIVNYKLESSPIGYCDNGSNTNDALEDAKAKWDAIEACNRENRTLLHLPPLSSGQEVDLTPCPIPALIPLPHPSSCTPCPDHASCSRHTVQCDNGYLLRPHSLLFFLPPVASSPTSFSLSSSSPTDLIWALISQFTNGLPGLGPIAFPPRCVEDPKRKRNIGVLGKAVESTLGQERGKRMCAGEGWGDRNKVIPQDEGGDARRWGVELERLREAMKRKTAPHLLGTFDDTFNEAIQQLIQWGGVITGEDLEGKRYLAHKTPDLSWNCAVTVKSREIWAEWRSTVLGALTLLFAGYLGSIRRASLRVQNKRVAELVQIALDTLRNQELAHHTDPITAPQPYLSSLQLRDLILQDEHSIPTRRALWNRVEKVVEGNANVRANLEELDGGDEMRVWRWVGSAGSGLRKRVQFEDRGEESGSVIA